MRRPDCLPARKRGEGDHPKGGGGVAATRSVDRAGTAGPFAFYPSTRLRLAPLPMPGMGRQP
jgi:hypothetical protein